MILMLLHELGYITWILEHNDEGEISINDLPTSASVMALNIYLKMEIRVGIAIVSVKKQEWRLGIHTDSPGSDSI